MFAFIYLVAILFSGYQEYLVYSIYSISYLPYTLIFYLIFLGINGEKINNFQILFPALESIEYYLKNKIYLNKVKTKRSLFIIYIIILLGSSLIGMYFLKPTIQLIDEQKKGLEIPIIETKEYRNNLTGDFDVEQKFKITFGLIPWAKFRPNISLIDKYGNPYHSKPENYYFTGEYVIINGSTWNSTNITLIGKKHEDNLVKIYKIEKKYLNDSFQIINLIFTNPYDLYINIYLVDIAIMDAGFELVSYNITGLHFDKEARESLDEILRNQTYKETVTIKDIGVRHESLHLNQSITLFLKKNNTFT